MGLLDRLRGGGKKKQDEDELKDNIEKIRQKIQEGEGAPAPGPGAAPAPDREMSQPPAPGEEQPPRPSDEGRPRPPREAEAEMPEQAAEPAEERGRPERGTTAGPQEPERPARGRGETAGPSAQEKEAGSELPAPPEVRELDLPDVEEGPLYVEVDTFRTTLQALADMRRVAGELDDHVGSMEGTLNEDRETASGMTDLLDRAEQTTRRMRQLLHNE